MTRIKSVRLHNPITKPRLFAAPPPLSTLSRAPR
jgi:hypothetical protein